MSTIVNLVQGTTEWHEHRRVHRNASETSVVLGCSSWTTPYQLWQQKLGLAKPDVNAAMLAWHRARARSTSGVRATNRTGDETSGSGRR